MKSLNRSWMMSLKMSSTRAIKSVGRGSSDAAALARSESIAPSCGTTHLAFAWPALAGCLLQNIPDFDGMNRFLLLFSWSRF